MANERPWKEPEGCKVTAHVCHDGVQYVYEFGGGWGASVVRHQFSYGYDAGLYELAVLKDGALDYDHPVANGDVRGHLNEREVGDLLREIAESTGAE